ncbi:hypothetical protein [Actinoplanes couchii]|uniref:hypothetical protein n=1 Tax=Actinoplanes couchii TaxID=403638 RepID=UPI00285BEB81|nr:hypothetical protein [Actinoplanes couchii]MDR6320556.1 hypothetical protein [Actinoplanes couchii]
MPAADPTPYWPDVEDWTGFLLVVVPVGELPVPAGEICRQVRARIEADPVLYDLVTVGHTPRVDPGTGRGLLTGVVEAAMPERHFFAPRGVIGVVFVATDKDAVRTAYENARRLPGDQRIWGFPYGTVAHPDGRAGIGAEAIQNCVRSIREMISAYEEQPEIAGSERDFLHRVTALIEAGLVSPEAARPEPLEPPEPRRPEPAPARPAPEPPASPRPAPAEPAPPSGAPAGKPVEDPVPGADPDRIVPPPEHPLPSVVYDRADVVTVDGRSAVRRLTGPAPTDTDCLDELQRDGRSVGLVYFVLVPDDGPVPRSTVKRRTEVVLELDQVFATVQYDPVGDRPAHVAVEVLAATTPVQRIGVLRRAGEMTESAVPRGSIEYFSLAESVDSLLSEVRRTARSLRARGLTVANIHFVFLATMAFPAEEATAHDWARLLRQARVTWIDFGPPDPYADRFDMPSTPFGLHVLSGEADAVTLIRQQSAPLYDYARPTPRPAPESAPRRWPFHRRSARR